MEPEHAFSFNLDTSYLLVSMLWSAIGAGFWIYGKKQRSAPQLYGGVVLIALPLLIQSAIWLSVASIAMIVGIYFWSSRQE